mmetsp:Transcript_60405/g.107629  ORF Transcript_60405/g.107629 Transcript_60405/m.107629 type:complete len:396 (+) Transcript_60405:85-1272(+)
MYLPAVLLLLVALTGPLLLNTSLIVSALNSLYPVGVALMEETRIPDQVLDVFLRPALRIGFWAMLEEQAASSATEVNAQLRYVNQLRQLPVALFTGEANEQHYEVETQFFDVALGTRKKYSSGIWDVSSPVATSGGPGLESSEDAMLDLYVQRADVRDGQTILDLGCGWGSVTLYLAERFPQAKIIGVSNSRTQKAYILGQASAKGFKNVEVETLNVASDAFKDFLQKKAGLIDRIISIEMFEHMKNYGKLLKLLHGALNKDGKLFVHIFCHKHIAYNFEENDLNGWMTKHFFKGGTMPSQHLLHYFQDDLVLRDQWNVNGRNYTLTLEGWLQRMDANKEQLLSVFGSKSDPHNAALQVRRWRIFMIACAEFFGFRGGTEFFVTHMLFEKRVAQQ